MKRGDIVTVAPPGEYSKPRPAVIVQCDELNRSKLSSVIICLITSHCTDAPIIRLPIEPSKESGLTKPSQIMTDKLLTVSRDKIGKRIGHLDDQNLVRLNRTLAFVLGLG